MTLENGSVSSSNSLVGAKKPEKLPELLDVGSGPLADGVAGPVVVACMVGDEAERDAGNIVRSPSSVGVEQSGISSKAFGREGVPLIVDGERSSMPRTA